MKSLSQNKILWYLAACLAGVSFVFDIALVDYIKDLIFDATNDPEKQRNRNLIIALIPAVIIPIVAYGILQLFEKIIWPLDDECQTGWYIYAFVRKQAKEIDNIIGYFELVHGIDNCYIHNSKVFVLDRNHNIEDIYSWTSEMIFINNNNTKGKLIKFIFSKKEDTTTVETNSGSAQINISRKRDVLYDGYFHMDEVKLRPTIGVKAYEGYIEDVSQYVDIYGDVYVEKIMRPKKVQDWSPETIIKENAHKMIRRVKVYRRKA